MKTLCVKEYAVAFCDNNGCFDEDFYDNLDDTMRFKNYGVRDGDYVIIYAIVVIENKTYGIELVNTSK